ncbi:MAG: putative Ig domain-containing protein [Acidobacteriota bacterium]|nr:putative Ig domain-containing protein [Acidobacteriota bacterium]
MRRYLVPICLLLNTGVAAYAQSLGGPVITTSTLPAGFVGTAYSATLTATGGFPPYSKWSVAQGSLPAGLTLGSTTGAISGTSSSAGAFNFIVTVSDSQGLTSQPKQLSISVTSRLAITTTSLPSGTVGTAYSAALSAIGGTPPYTWSATGSLPPGLALDAFKGVISGTPTTATGSPFGFIVTVKDSTANLASPQQSSQDFSITIIGGVLVTTTFLPNGGVGLSYSATLTASGGVTPYVNWTLTGSLPPGLTLNSAGVITGTPTTPVGSPFYSFGVSVKDSAGNVSPTQQLTITISAGATITTTALPNGVAGSPYSAKLAAAGTLPFNWILTGNLPPGLTLDASTGVISGSPTTAAGSPFNFTVSVKDASGITSVPQPFSITITTGVTIITTALPGGTAATTYSTQLAASGGTPPYSSWTATGPLPPGLTLNSASGVISGTPTTAFGSPFNFTVTVKDSQGNTSTPKALSIAIGAPATGNLPVINKVNGITDLISPNSIGFVSGTNLGPQASVLINGVQNLVVFSRSDLVVFQISPRLSPGPAMVIVQKNGLSSDPFPITLSTYSPGIFVSANPDDTFPRAGGQPNPASSGDRIFFFATGLGTLTPPAPPVLRIDGQSVAVASTSMLPKVIGDPSALPIDIPVLYFDIPFGLKPGNHSVTIQAGGFSSNVANLHTVSSGIILTQTGLTFRAVAGQPAPPPQSFAVLSGSGALNFTTSTSTLPEGLGWLSITPAGGTAQAGQPGVVVQVQVNHSGLVAGTHFGLVTISSADAVNSPKVVVVVLEVSAPGTNPGPELNKTALLFTASPGGSDPGAQTISVTNLGAQPLSFVTSIVANSQNPFSVQPATGNVTAGQPVSITVKASAVGLQAGVYTANLRIAFSDGTVKNVGLLLVVAAGASSSTSSFSSSVRAAGSVCSPTKLVPQIRQLESNFNKPAGYPTPIEVNIIDDCTAPMTTGTVKVRFSNGDPTLYPTNQHNGLWTVTWAAVNPRPSGLTVTVEAEQQEANLQGTAQVTGAVQPNTAVPFVSVGGVVESASYSAAPAPGSLVSIFGGKLSGGTGSATQLPLSTLLLATKVQVAGRELPLVFTSDGQVNALLPYDLPVDATVQLIARNANAISVGQDFTLGVTRPAVFTLDNSGKGQGHIYKVDSAGTQTLAGGGTPVKAGDVLVAYSSGLGAVDPPVAAGTATPSTFLTKTVNPVTVTIGGKAAPVAFAGLTPGFTGLYQVNITVPDGLPDDDATAVVLTSAGQSSAPVTISVHK